MSKIVSNFFISVDGVVEAPDQWHFPYFDDEMGAVMGQGMSASGAFLMGRRVYDAWSQYWPNADKDQDFAAFINGIDKYVVSDTLKTADWQNTTIVSGDVAGRLREIKERTDGDLTMSGSATLVRWLLANDLLDELHLLVHPIVVGKGQRLFEDTPTHPLKLVGQRALGSGVVYLTYAPDQPR